MAKTTHHLPTTEKGFSRRHLLATAALFCTAVSGSVRDTLAATITVQRKTPTMAAPTANGRLLLKLISEQRAAMDAACEAGDESGERWAPIYHKVQRLGDAITARPASSMADVVDRAILAAWACDPYRGALIPEGDDPGGFKAKHILAVLAMAGIDPAECNVSL